jgi:hypothetical protein
MASPRLSGRLTTATGGYRQITVFLNDIGGAAQQLRERPVVIHDVKHAVHVRPAVWNERADLKLGVIFADSHEYLDGLSH